MKEKSSVNRGAGLCGNIEYDSRKRAAARRKDMTARNFKPYNPRFLLCARAIDLVVKMIGYREDYHSAKSTADKDSAKSRMDEINSQYPIITERLKKFSEGNRNRTYVNPSGIVLGAK